LSPVPWGLAADRSVTVRSFILLGCLRNSTMRIKNILLSRAFVEIPVALRRLVQRHNCRVDDLRYRETVMQDCLHQLSVITEHRRLPGEEAVTLRPSEAAPHSKVPLLCGFILRPRIFCNVQACDADCATCTPDRHH